MQGCASSRLFSAWRMVAATLGSWRCKTGMASAHDAQWAGVDSWEALMRPKPPMARGRCALAKASTGSESVCRSCVRQRLMSRSCCSAKVAVCAGGSSRSK